jgi:ferredoxin like protein
MADDIFNLSLEDKLYRTKFEPDKDKPHIKVNNDICLTCTARTCISICPAGVYKDDPNDKRLILVSHENCLECGTCYKHCPSDAIDWKYPDGGRGVKYRFG